MADNDKYQELVGLAGEYVLGTLAGDERREFEDRMKSDEVLAQAVEGWQERLDPLAETIEPIEPPIEMFDKIVARIDGRDNESSAQIIQLTKRVTKWRRMTAMAGAIAASLLVFIVVRQFNPIGVAPNADSYIAVLQAGDKNPAFVASIDLKQGRIDIVRLADKAEAGKSFELWAIGGDRDKPQSLGVIDPMQSLASKPLLQTANETLEDTVFAVSLEPAGGSPTGQPTGPVLFTGKLVKIEDR